MLLNRSLKTTETMVFLISNVIQKETRLPQNFLLTDIIKYRTIENGIDEDIVQNYDKIFVKQD